MPPFDLHVPLLSLPHVMKISEAELHRVSAEPYLSRGLVSRPFAPACEVRASMITRKGVPHSGLLLSFMEELRRQLAQGAGTAPLPG